MLLLAVRVVLRAAAEGEVMSHQNWAKMSADLDSNPKVRRAGRLGREVFLFALRRNAAREGTGMVPAADLEAWYVADVLQISEKEATAGLSAAIAAGLLIPDDRCFLIGGWDDEWAKRPMSPSERQALKRSKDAARDPSRSVRDSVTPERDCHALEERRGELQEERREESAPPVLPPSPPSRKSRAKAKSTDLAPELRASAEEVLRRLEKQSGVSYQGSEPQIQLVASRLRSGLTETDLRAVIGYCASPEPDGLGWKGDAKMHKYLRPKTLFGPKNIEDYLYPARKWWADLALPPVVETPVRRGPSNIVPLDLTGVQLGEVAP